MTCQSQTQRRGTPNLGTHVRAEAEFLQAGVCEESLREILECFQSYNDLRREELEIFENSFGEREDKLQLSVQTLESSSVLGIQICCGRYHHAVGVSELAGAKVERFHTWEVIAGT